MFTGKNAKQSEKVLARINAKVEVRISATPKTLQPDAFIKIERSQVINEGMIKMGISLNPAIRGVLSDEALNIILLKQAMQKRQKLADAYKALGVNINPLLLIQLPNDQSATMSQDEESLKESLLANLGMMNATPDNGKVAVWLSGEKRNLDGIEKNNSVVDVLLFKQAIAMGWDCPRAAVLLIYRKLSSETFTIQTVGRIMRMPQQRFYTDPDLNTGYVYTDLSADVIKIEPDDMDYIKKLHSYKREGLNNVALRSVKRERSNKENNVLRSDFKQVLQEYFAREWTLTYQPSLFSWDDEEDDDAPYSSKVQENRRIASQHVNLNVQSIKVEIPSDMNILDEEKTIRVENKTGFARTPYELKQVFERFCSSMLNGWSKSKCM
jgi:type III restriction enzyme